MKLAQELVLVPSLEPLDKCQLASVVLEARRADAELEGWQVPGEDQTREE